MANHKSAIKRARQNEKRRMKNKMYKTQVKNVTKDVRARAEEGAIEEAAGTLKKAMRLINKAASRGVIHKATASRKISRLARLLNKAAAPQA